jgi:hypothetical protein
VRVRVSPAAPAAEALFLGELFIIFYISLCLAFDKKKTMDF